MVYRSLLTLLVFAAALAAQPRKPNVVVILADDLGFADVSFNGCRDYDTPNLDRLAASGVRFTNGYVTHPYCSPSRAGLLTGRYQQRFGHEHNPPYAPDDDRVGTDAGEVFLSDLLRDVGYRTAAFGKWHLGYRPQFLPAARGFDEFFGFPGGGFDYYGRPNRNRPEDRVIRGATPVPLDELTYLTDDFSREAADFIRRNRDNPFFIYLAYNAVHSPDQAPERYLQKTLHVEDPFRTVYAAMAVAMDEGVGQVLKALEETGVRDDTLVFFLSDNGGRIGSDNRPLRGHKGMLYEGGIRVPFTASWPARLPAGKIYGEPVSALDILPTAIAAAGIDVVRTKPLDGVNLAPYLDGRAQGAPHETLYWRVISGQGWAVRRGRYKLIQPAALGRIQLFDLDADPREIHDLAAEKPAVVGELKTLYERWNAQLEEPRWTDPHGENVRKEYEAKEEARRKARPPQ